MLTQLVNKSIMKKQFRNGPLVKRLTHMPFTHAFMGSNPVRVTILKFTDEKSSVFFTQRETYDLKPYVKINYLLFE